MNPLKYAGVDTKQCEATGNCAIPITLKSLQEHCSNDISALHTKEARAERELAAGKCRSRRKLCPCPFATWSDAARESSREHEITRFKMHGARTGRVALQRCWEDL